MKRLKYLPAFLFVFLAVLSTLQGSSQPFKKGLPSIEILLTDSISRFHTQAAGHDKPIILLLFHTTCEHCQQQARDMVSKKKQLEATRLIMISTEPVSTIRKFSADYALSSIKGLVIGRDVQLVTPRMFMYESFPFSALYDRRHRFISSFERNFNSNTLLNELKKKGAL